MPKRRELEPWEQKLVSAIKEQHRFGYSVRPMRDKVQVQRFWSDTGKRETVTLTLAWEKGCQRFRPSAPTDSLCQGLIHADVQGQKLRGDLLEELPFRFDRCQSVDHLSLLVFVGEDFKPFW